MRLFTTAVFAGVMVTMGFSGCGDEDPSSGAAARGAPTFRRVCAACHGLTGKGMPNLGKDMTRSEFIASRSDEELLKFVKLGRLPSDPLSAGMAAMPPKGGDPTLTDKQMLDVIVFIRTIQVKPAG